MSTPRSANLEQIFKRVEEESERRALAEELREQTRSRASSPLLAPATSFTTINSGVSQKRDRDRRRGSVSISRFGQHETPVETNPKAIPGPPSKFSHFDFSGGLYRQPQSSSVDSFGSETAETSPIDNHVTQLHHISGRQTISKTVGGMLSRTISRSRSKNNLTTMDTQNLIIGVSVEEATVEQEGEHGYDDEEGLKTSRSTSTIHASLKKEPLKHLASTGDNRGWVDRAKELTRVLRRKTLRGGDKPSVSPAPKEL